MVSAGLFRGAAKWVQPFCWLFSFFYTHSNTKQASNRLWLSLLHGFCPRMKRKLLYPDNSSEWGGRLVCECVCVFVQSVGSWWGFDTCFSPFKKKTNKKQQFPYLPSMHCCTHCCLPTRGRVHFWLPVLSSFHPLFAISFQPPRP